jgi:hypothetical protein
MAGISERQAQTYSDGGIPRAEPRCLSGTGTIGCVTRGCLNGFLKAALPE